MIITYNTYANNTRKEITANSVNIIQEGLDQIVQIWGLAQQGSTKAIKGQPCKSELINNWITWLKIYSERIGATSETSMLDNIYAGDPMLWGRIQEIYDKTQIVKNWCNRSECNSSECNWHESNSGESNNSEF